MFMMAKHFYPFLMIFFYLVPYSLGLTLSFELKLTKKNSTGSKTVPKDLSDEYQIVLNTNASKDLSEKYQIVLNTNTSKEIISLISELTLSASTLKSKSNSSTSKLNISSSSQSSSTKTSTLAFNVDSKKPRILPKIIDKVSSKATTSSRQSTTVTSTTKITKTTTTEAEYPIPDYDDKNENENENQRDSVTHESEIALDISNAPEGILKENEDYQVNKINSNCCFLNIQIK